MRSSRILCRYQRKWSITNVFNYITYVISYKQTIYALYVYIGVYCIWSRLLHISQALIGFDVFFGDEAWPTSLQRCTPTRYFSCLFEAVWKTFCYCYKFHTWKVITCPWPWIPNTANFLTAAGLDFSMDQFKFSYTIVSLKLRVAIKLKQPQASTKWLVQKKYDLSRCLLAARIVAEMAPSLQPMTWYTGMPSESMMPAASWASSSYIALERLFSIATKNSLKQFKPSRSIET